MTQISDQSLPRLDKTTALIKLWLPRLVTVLAALAFLYMSFNSIRLLYMQERMALGYRYSFDYGEGPILDQVARLSRFENIYQKDLSVYPYSITNYPPLYPLVQVPFYALFGPSFLYGRIISLLGVLAAAIFLGLTIHRITRNWLAGMAGGLVLLAFPYILHWMPFVRVDSLALGLSWAGLFCLVRWEDRRWGLILGGMLLLAAVFTRQSYGLAAPLAAFVWLLRQAPRKRAFVLAGWMAGVGLAIFLLLTLLSGGGFFTHIVTANVNPFVWQTVQNNINDLQANIPYLLAGAAIFLLGGFWASNRSWWLVTPYVIGASLSALTIGKDGSNINYLYELCAALALAAGAFIAWPGRRWWLSALLVLILGLQVTQMAEWTRSDYYDRSAVRLLYRPKMDQMNTLVQESEGPILADEYMSIMALNGKPVVFQPFEFKMMSQAGLWDQKPFLESIRDRQYTYILLYDPLHWDSRHARWTPEMLDAIEKNYSRVRKLGETTLYEPKP